MHQGLLNDSDEESALKSVLGEKGQMIHCGNPVEKPAEEEVCAWCSFQEQKSSK